MVTVSRQQLCATFCSHNYLGFTTSLKVGLPLLSVCKRMICTVCSFA